MNEYDAIYKNCAEKFNFCQVEYNWSKYERRYRNVDGKIVDSLDRKFIIGDTRVRCAIGPFQVMFLFHGSNSNSASA